MTRVYSNTPAVAPKAQAAEPAAKPAAAPSGRPAVLTTLDGMGKPAAATVAEVGLKTDLGAMRELARAAPVQSVASFAVNDFTTLKGKLAHRQDRGFGEGGDHVPGGHWMVLDEPIRVGGKEVKELYIDLDGPVGCGVGGGNACGSCSLSSACSGKALEPGDSFSLHGRLDELKYGGNELPPSSYFAISGVSNPANGEPRYDGKNFVSASTGAPLDKLVLIDQQNEDRPDNLIILDTDKRLAHIGNFGGALPEGYNPFNAYTAQRPIEMPGTAEKKALVFDDRGRPSNPLTKESLDPLSQDREGRVWYIDRSTRTVWGVKDGAVSRLIRLKVGDLLGEPRETPYGTWQGNDGRGGHGVATPRDQWVNDKKMVSIPRRMDPDIHGTSLVKDVKGVFADMVTHPDNSIPVEEFYAMLEARCHQLPGGPETLKQIDETIEEAKRLYVQGVAAKPPLDDKLWRRAMMQSFVHSWDLGVVMNAMGFDATGCAGKHDMTELVPASDLKWQVGRKYMEPWLEKYVNSLKPDEQVNISFLNPHYAAAMFTWGDSRIDANNMMDPHRLSPHHNGNSEEDVTWVEKALNFLAHHMPREHMGIRHQERGDWANLEHVLATDPAIKYSEVGKAIARDGAKVWQMLEAEGKVVPWQKLKVPEGVPTPKLERSYEVLQGTNAAGDRLYFANSRKAEAALSTATPAVREAATALLAAMKTLPETLDVGATAAFTALAAQTANGTPADKALVTTLGEALSARYAQQASLSMANIEKLMPQISLLEAAMGRDRPQFMSIDELRSSAADMEKLPEYAQKAEQGNDLSTAATLRTWHSLWKEGLKIQSLAR